MASWHGSVIDFNSFHEEIEAAIEQNQIYASVLIRELDKKTLVPEIQTWLLKRTGVIGIIGYLRDERLYSFFDKDVLIEEFDELYLSFRDYLRNQKGIDPDNPLTLVRFRDNLSFVPIEGEPNDNAYYGQYGWTNEYCQEVEFESDPFLPVSR